MIKRNTLREKLNAGEPTIGTHVHVLWPGLVEVIGYSESIDYIEFQGEYAPYDLLSLENFGRAVELFPHLSSMMKIEQTPRTYLAVRANGSGIQNLLFADIRDAEDARSAVASARADTPTTGGVAGAGMRRDVGYVMGAGSQDYVQALEDGVVALMIEKESALDQLEDILSVKGIDMVQFGPADYSMSLGIAGQWDDPRVKNAEIRVIETALRMGVQPRIELPDSSGAERYLEMGVKHFCIGWDVSIIHEWCKLHGGTLSKLIDS